MCLSVRRIVKGGGKTARMTSLARITGTRDGIGAQVRHMDLHCIQSG